MTEIQAFPDLLAKLRWFAEEMPELALIATGSLLELVLKEHTFSMPVGRITYVHLEPLSFDEFLMAHGQNALLHYLETYTLDLLHNPGGSIKRIFLASSFGPDFAYPPGMSKIWAE